MPSATITQISNFQRGERIVHVTSAAQLVNTTLDHEINTSGIDRIFVALTVAVAALTGFAIKAKPTYNATPLALYDAAADFLVPSGLLVGASGDLTTQAVGTGWFIMDVRGLESITLTATSGGTATIALEAGGA